MKRPLKVFSASISLVLVGQLLLLPVNAAETPAPNTASSKLVEWSTDEVKAYFDPAVDWNLPVPPTAGTASPSPSPTPTAGSGSTGGGTAPIVVNNYGGGGSGFGWDDLLLYHLIFNSPSPYSSSSWGSSHRSYYYRSNTPYVTKTYQPSSFSNRSTTKAPTTSSGTGTFTTNKSSSSNTKSGTTGSTKSTGSTGNVGSTGNTGSVSSSGTSSGTTSGSKSTSTSTGSIGGKSSGFSSSSSSGG
ncbi:hypothetical protein HZF08_38145 [Paenibacillus sp. CGMCC 1.16610]|uniref:Uncharacterized protein n=1 Tax=Paenibacillus anseongense TaxID=2682845 RepID=A0ABW9UFN2_9BACL|nr:hypothetical protein [Paenibacillus sp. CGMCC 1.16610]MBA2944099.1 hypothetical protein [Paenibacillus sp. CGMCC 1.16610]MVQ37988.1 hypothetical protein [Paenibacillus anseongense]